MTKVEYTLSGCANGHPVRIVGRGAVTGSGARVAFTAAEAPCTFDAGLAHFAGLDAAVALAAGLATAPDCPLVARCRTDLLGEGGVEIGTIVAMATVERRRGHWRCAVQLAEAKVAVEAGERLTSIDTRTITMVAQAGGVALLSATTAATSRGREMTVLITVALDGAEPGPRRSMVAPSTAVGRTAARHR